MNNQPLVSVIVPTYNRPDLLKNALQSVLRQDYDNWEAIVINDAGLDVGDIALSADPEGRIVYLSHVKNKGLPAARNSGMSKSRGEIICYLDDDDEFLDNHLSTVVQAFAERDELVVYTDAEYIYKQKDGDTNAVLGADERYKDMTYSKNTLLANNYIPVNSIAHKRKLMDLAGNFNETFTAFEDWELWLRYSAYTDFYHIKKTTVNVIQSSSESSMLFREKKRYPEILQRLFKMYPVESEEVKNARNLVMLNARAELAALKMAGANDGYESESEKYRDWVELHRLSQLDVDLMLRRLDAAQKKPGIHLLVIVDSGNKQQLAELMNTLSTQIYEEWGMSIFSSDPRPDIPLTQLEMIEWVQYVNDLDQNVNSEVARVAADWVCVLPVEATLEPHSLLKIVDYINHYSEWKYIYPDHDVLDASQERASPFFKPCFDVDLLRSMNYIGSFAVVRREEFLSVGGYRGFGNLTNYDIAFRISHRYGDSAIGHIEDILFHENGSVTYDTQQQSDIINSDMTRRGLNASITSGYYPCTFQVDYIHTSKPLVSIILPTRNMLEYLQPCLDSILSRTDYPEYEVIIVDNDSDDPDMMNYLEAVQQQHSSRVRKLKWSGNFNFSAMINDVVPQVQGEYILILHNDTQIIQDQWLSRMMSVAQRKDVGIVGARLLSPGAGKIQHAGYVLGKSSSVGSTYSKSIDIKDPGYQGLAQVTRGVTAVSSACMLMRKSLYQQTGGMDESNFARMYNDVDLCIRVEKQGCRVIWTPYASLLHHGGASAQTNIRDAKDQVKAVMQHEKELDAYYDRYIDLIGNDRFYNRHLSLVDDNVKIEHQVICNWDTNFHDMPRVYGVPLSGGAGEYRVKAPFRMLERNDVCQTDSSISKKVNVQRFPSLSELKRIDPDVVLFHSPIADEPLNVLRKYRKHTDIEIVLTMDDLVTELPESNPFRKIAPRNARSRLREALGYSDRMIVTTEPLKSYCENMIEEIHVIPNYLENEVWSGLESSRGQGSKPRVGWAGAQQHGGDLAFILDIVKETAAEVDWVFFGMCPDAIKSYVAEEHEFVMSFTDYSRKLASLNLDLAIAPLEVHPFNEAKSNLRLLEYGVFGWPVICTDIYPYQNAPVKRVQNNRQEWLTAIRERVHDLEAAYQEGNALRDWVTTNHMLNDHVDEWRQALLGNSGEQVNIGQAKYKSGNA